jgi:two-component system OmpR family response regulator
MKTSPLRILIVEDDSRMSEFIQFGLRELGHLTSTAGSAEQGQWLLGKEEFDAILLDVQLPGQSGYSVVQALHARLERPAIIMLTALNQEDHVVWGLDAGADDYVTKPFSFPVLVARISSAVRRARSATANELCFGPFRIDTLMRRVFHQDVEIHVSRSEYLLLHELALNRGEIVLRRQLMMAIWRTTSVSNGALDVLVNSLREKLGSAHPDLIATVRGKGYALLNNSNRKDGTSL